MEDIRIIHEFEENNKNFIIAESIKKHCKCSNWEQFQIKYILNIQEKYLMGLYMEVHKKLY